MHNSLPHLTHVTINFRKFHEYPTVSEFEHITSTAVESSSVFQKTTKKQQRRFTFLSWLRQKQKQKTEDANSIKKERERKKKKKEEGFYSHGQLTSRRLSRYSTLAASLFGIYLRRVLSCSASSVKTRIYHTFSTGAQCFICKGTNLPYFLDRSTVNIYIYNRERERERERESLILLHL